jgi:dCMP deaminase
MMEDGHCVRTIHAEVRAILNAAKYGLATTRSTMYSILKPCFQCTKVIVAAGISKIVYAGAAYDEDRTMAVILNAPWEIEVVKLDTNLDYA